MARSSNLSAVEAQVPQALVVIALASCGVALVFATDAIPDMSQRLSVALLAALCYCAAAVCWMARSAPRVGPWLSIVSLQIVMFLGDRLLAVEGLLALLALPPLVAAAVLSLEEAALVSIAETLLLWLYTASSPGQVRTHPLVVVVAIWGSFAVLWGVHRSLQRTAAWAWAHTRRAQELLEQARDRKAELQQALDDLAHANRQLALANERTAALRLIAEQAQQAKVAFVSRVSHEFRTPLNMIIGLVGLMVRRPYMYGREFPPDLWQDLQVVQRNCEHLASMVNDVLDLTRLDAGQIALRRESVRVTDIVHSALEIVGPLLERKGLGLTVDVPADLPPIVCDPTRIRQVVLNVLSNAARFTERGGITVGAEVRGDSMLLRITDTGPGIAAEDLSAAFEPFWQTGSGSQSAGGTGLGLSISKQFVELHGGRIWLESQVGVGTTCYVELPLSPSNQGGSMPWRWNREDWEWRERDFIGARAAATPHLTKPRVVVCDETGGLGSQLERHADLAELVSVASLEEAALLLADTPAHALLLNASSVDRAWGELEAVRGQISDVALCGCVVSPSEARAVGLGAQGHLVKPVGEADLLQAVQSTGRCVRRILLVDDEIEFLTLLRRMLKMALPEVEVFTATSGAQALEKAARLLPDLVFLDITMPDMSGWQVLEQLRRERTAEELAIYILSAQDPGQQALASPFLILSTSDGMPVRRLLCCALQFSAMLLGPGR